MDTNSIEDVAESPRYSTLELVKHDNTAAAPERDNALTAPENDRQHDAPQVRYIMLLCVYR